MILNQYRVVSLCGDTEELATTAEEAALNHVRSFSPTTRLTVVAVADGKPYGFRVEPTINYRAFPVEVPPCFEVRQ